MPNDEPKQLARPSIFVAYPFEEDYEWIKYCVPPLLRRYGCNVLSGESSHTQEINLAVADRIAQSNLVVAFLTRDQALADGGFVPSEWVLQEIGFARGKGIPVVLLRERDVKTGIGIAGNIQFIDLLADDEAFLAFLQLRAAIRESLFKGQSDEGLAVCHLSKPGRRDQWRKQWWDFWLWIDGSEDDLDLIAEVKYEFPKGFVPLEEDGDPYKGFGNYAETDVAIAVKVRIRFKSGKLKRLIHRITLPGAGISPISE